MPVASSAFHWQPVRSTKKMPLEHPSVVGAGTVAAQRVGLGRVDGQQRGQPLPQRLGNGELLDRTRLARDARGLQTHAAKSTNLRLFG